MNGKSIAKTWGLVGLLSLLVLTLSNCGGLGGDVAAPVFTANADVEIVIEGEIYDSSIEAVRFFRKTLRTDLAFAGVGDETDAPPTKLLDINMGASFPETGEWLQLYIFNVDEASPMGGPLPSFPYRNFPAEPRGDVCNDFSSIYYEDVLDARGEETFKTRLDSGLDPSNYAVAGKPCWDLDPGTQDPAPVFDQGELTILGWDDTDGDTLVDTLELSFWFSAYTTGAGGIPSTRIEIRSSRFLLPFCRDARRQSDLCERMPFTP
jgi:hypothetical protein